MPCFASFSMASSSSLLEVWVKSDSMMYPIPGSSMKAYRTDFVGISARVIVMWMGSANPTRRIVIVTGLPLGPRSLRTTSSVVMSSLSSSSPTWVMMSPARMPIL